MGGSCLAWEEVGGASTPQTSHRRVGETVLEEARRRQRGCLGDPVPTFLSEPQPGGGGWGLPLPSRTLDSVGGCLQGCLVHAHRTVDRATRYMLIPWAVMTNDHHFGGLKQEKFTCSLFWKPGFLRYQQGRAPLKMPGDSPSFASPSP